VLITLHDDDTEPVLWMCLVCYSLTLGYIVWEMKIGDRYRGFV
jgi:hypothetical protein